MAYTYIYIEFDVARAWRRPLAHEYYMQMHKRIYSCELTQGVRSIHIGVHIDAQEHCIGEIEDSRGTSRHVLVRPLAFQAYSAGSFSVELCCRCSWSKVWYMQTHSLTQPMLTLACTYTKKGTADNWNINSCSSVNILFLTFDWIFFW